MKACVFLYFSAVYSKFRFPYYPLFLALGLYTYIFNFDFMFAYFAGRKVGSRLN